MACGAQAAPLRIAAFNAENGLGLAGTTNYETAAKLA